MTRIYFFREASQTVASFQRQMWQVQVKEPFGCLNMSLFIQFDNCEKAKAKSHCISLICYNLFAKQFLMHEQSLVFLINLNDELLARFIFVQVDTLHFFLRHRSNLHLTGQGCDE